MRFQPNPNFKAEMRRDPDLRRHVHKTADEVRDKAERLGAAKGAPWMPRKGNPGRTYIVDDTAEGARVTNQEHGGHLVEWGSKNNPPHAPLRRAVRAVGLRLRDIGKNAQ